MRDYPTLKSERLVLRAPKAKDIPIIAELANDPIVAEMTLNVPHPYQEKDAVYWVNMANEGFQEKSRYIFAIELKQTPGFIGGIGLHINRRFNRAEAGFWVGKPYRNKGYCTEALKTLLQFGFDRLKLNKILATHLVKNKASGRVMFKSGMIKEAVLAEHIKKGEAYFDLAQYRATSKEFYS